MTETPRTDALLDSVRGDGNIIAIVECARQLERELAVANEARQRAEEWLAEYEACEACRHDQAARVKELEEALRFYAEKHHFMLSDENAWDTVSGEPQNFWCDEVGTATVEDGWIARAALAESAQSGQST